MDSAWDGDLDGLNKKRISEHGGARSGACMYQKMRPVTREVSSLAMIPCRLHANSASAFRYGRYDHSWRRPAQKIENVANLAVRGGRSGCLVIAGKDGDSPYPRLRMASHAGASVL